MKVMIKDYKIGVKAKSNKDFAKCQKCNNKKRKKKKKR